MDQDYLLALPRTAVDTIEYDEPRVADSEAASREDDELQRRTLLSGAGGEINLAQAAQLAGEHFSRYGDGPRCRALIEEAREGRLLLVTELGWARCGEDRIRQHPMRARVDRGAMREWLVAHADDFPAWRLRSSALAQWAGCHEE